MLTLTRRLSPFLLAGLLLVPQAAPAAAGTDTVSASDLTRAGTDLVRLTNQKRTAHGLVALRQDGDLMQIAQDRAKVAGGQDHEVAYEAGKTGASRTEVRDAVKDFGNSRKTVEDKLGK